MYDLMTDWLVQPAAFALEQAREHGFASERGDQAVLLQEFAFAYVFSRAPGTAVYSVGQLRRRAQRLLWLLLRTTR